MWLLFTGMEIILATSKFTDFIKNARKTNDTGRLVGHGNA